MFALTLTYAGTPVAAEQLIYSDVQTFIKSLRNDGFSVRYICAGEYGTMKQRAHWHICLFFKGDSPDGMILDQRVNWKYWPHGFTYFQNPDMKGFRYVMKYTVEEKKFQNTGNSNHRQWQKFLMMSKKPPLGYEFFMQRALDIAKAGLPLRDASYSFYDALEYHPDKKQYRPIVFWLKGRMKEMYMEHYAFCWKHFYKTDPPETEFLYEQHFDKIAREEMSRDPERIERMLELRRAERAIAPYRSDNSPEVDYIKSVATLLVPTPQPCIMVLRSDGSVMCRTQQEDEEWLILESGENAAVLAARLSAYNVPRSLHRSVLNWYDAKSPSLRA